MDKHNTHYKKKITGWGNLRATRHEGAVDSAAVKRRRWLPTPSATKVNRCVYKKHTPKCGIYLLCIYINIQYNIFFLDFSFREREWTDRSRRLDVSCSAAAAFPPPPQRHPPLLYDQATNQYPAGLFVFLFPSRSFSLCLFLSPLFFFSWFPYFLSA